MQRLAASGVCQQPGSASGVCQRPGNPQNVLDVPTAEVSEAIRHILSDCVRVEFASRGGLAFRAIQAKRAGIAFNHTTLALVVDDTAAEQRFRDGRLPASLVELVEDHAERYCFSYADEIVHTHRRAERVNAPIGGRAERVNAPVALATASCAAPLVTVVVPYFNLGPFLPAALASLAAQTYGALEVIVIDDGSTDPESVAVFERMRECYPSFRFVRQHNHGIGATRNIGLQAGHGEYLVPFDADNLARPDMIETFVRAGQRCPDTAAFTCYFHAFKEDADIARGRFSYACRPTGGPYVLAASQNIYGDACAIYRRKALLECGGFETDRNTSFEDWELFVKMVGCGYMVDVVPEVLFYYRHRGDSFSRATNGYANHQRVLRQFAHAEKLPLHERELLGCALAGLERGREAARVRGLASRMWRWLRGEGG